MMGRDFEEDGVVQPGVRRHRALVAALAVRRATLTPIGQIRGLRLASVNIERENVSCKWRCLVIDLGESWKSIHTRRS